MFAVPGLLALAGVGRSRAAMLIVAVLYAVMIGFRFKVGADWNSYVDIYNQLKGLPVTQLIFRVEPAFKLLVWLAHWSGGGLILINLFAGLVFCWGFFAVAWRTPEPLLAATVGTPLLAITFAMSATRQAIAAGIIFYLYATWDK